MRWVGGVQFKCSNVSYLYRVLQLCYMRHRLLYKWTMHGNSPSIAITDPTTCRTKKSKLIDLVIRIEFTSVILMPLLKFSEKFDPPFSHVFRFGNMFPESHGFVAVRLQAVSKIHVRYSIELVKILYLISEGRRNCSTFLPM